MPLSDSRNATLLKLLALALTICSASAMRVVFSALQEAAKVDLDLSDLQLSLVQGLAVSIPIAVLSIPIGRITDRGNRLRLLILLGVIWSLGSLATAFVSGFYGLFVARMLAGVGAMCAIPVAISIAADMSPPERRGRSLLFLSIGNIAGGAIAFAAGGWLLEFVGSAHVLPGTIEPWRGVHLVFGIAGFLLLLALSPVREPTRHEIAERIHTHLAPALREIWSMRRFLGPMFLGQLTVVMADTAAGIWAAPVLGRNYGLEPQDFAGWMGAVILGAGIAGSLVGGIAADIGQKTHGGKGILVSAVIAAWVSVPAAGFCLAPGVPTFAAMLALLLACGTITGLVTATAIAVLVPNEVRGVCIGLFVVVGGVVGLGIAPTTVTMVSDALGGEDALRYGLAGVTAVTSVAAALGFTFALRSIGARRPIASDGIPCEISSS